MNRAESVIKCAVSNCILAKGNEIQEMDETTEESIISYAKEKMEMSGDDAKELIEACKTRALENKKPDGRFPVIGVCMVVIGLLSLIMQIFFMIKYGATDVVEVILTVNALLVTITGIADCITLFPIHKIARIWNNAHATGDVDKMTAALEKMTALAEKKKNVF